MQDYQEKETPFKTILKNYKLKYFEDLLNKNQDQPYYILAFNEFRENLETYSNTFKENFLK